MNWFKLKTDGTFLGSTGQAGKGRLIPNEKGNLVKGLDAMEIVLALNNVSYPKLLFVVLQMTTKVSPNFPLVWSEVRDRARILIEGAKI